MVNSIVSYLFIVLFVSIPGVILIRKGNKLLRSSSSLRQQGVVVEGHVTGREPESARQTTRWYTLNYRYEYNGKSYSCRQLVSHNYYTAHDIGTAVPVRCLPGKPAEAALVDGDYEGLSNLSYLLGGFCLVGSGIFGLAIIITSYVILYVRR